MGAAEIILLMGLGGIADPQIGGMVEVYLTGDRLQNPSPK